MIATVYHSFYNNPNYSRIFMLLAYGLLEDRCTIDVTITKVFLAFSEKKKKTNIKMAETSVLKFRGRFTRMVEGGFRIEYRPGSDSLQETRTSETISDSAECRVCKSDTGLLTHFLYNPWHSLLVRIHLASQLGIFMRRKLSSAHVLWVYFHSQSKKITYNYLLFVKTALKFNCSVTVVFYVDFCSF